VLGVFKCTLNEQIKSIYYPYSDCYILFGNSDAVRLGIVNVFNLLVKSAL